MNTILSKLVDDAQLVADIGVELGQIKDEAFITALSDARKELDTNTISPGTVPELQRHLNGAIKDLLPITLGDLRSGWRPYASTPHKQIGTVIFGLFSCLLLIAVAYATQVYERARSLYSVTLELQESRGAEQAIRLFGLVKRNQKEVIESLTNGKKEFLYDVLSKALFDLEVMNIRVQAYLPIAQEVFRDLNMWCRAQAALGWKSSACDPAADIKAIQDLSSSPSYGPQPTLNGGSSVLNRPPSLALNALKDMNVHSLMKAYIDNLRAFNSVINVDFDPLYPTDYSYNISQLRYHMTFLGAWLLPALYGMLGAVIFHMRRLLDPALPNPSWLRFAFRIVLGGFAGIVVAWFLAPSSPKLSQPEFATLTTFGLAFLVGFSTDVFFQMLDRMVNQLSQAFGRGNVGSGEKK